MEKLSPEGRARIEAMGESLSTPAHSCLVLELQRLSESVFARLKTLLPENVHSAFFAVGVHDVEHRLALIERYVIVHDEAASVMPVRNGLNDYVGNRRRGSASLNAEVP